ncbi:hypothetical protein HY501_00510 [Candidatus Woesearchaeota archaeon]|nr:hypothetical protein [Candidatus Woesearchaeota archaeon]
MKRIFPLLVFALFIVGCVSQVVDNAQVDVGGPILDDSTVDLEDIVEEEAETPAEVSSDEFTLKPGETIVVDGVPVNLKSMTPELLAQLNVGGKDIRLLETRGREIESGLDMTLAQWVYKGKDNPENYVVLKIVPLVLGEHEYLLEKEEEVTIEGKTVRLLQAKSDGSIYVLVLPSLVSEQRVPPGETMTIEGIEITPVLTFTRDNSRLPYAIVKLEA